MPENFQQTVDLREQAERRKTAAAPKSKINPLEKIFEDEEPGKDLRKISRPKTLRLNGGLIRRLVFILAVIVVATTAYFLFFHSKGAANPAKEKNWYAVKLVDGTIYYGQVADAKVDPVEIKNVYFNYDQFQAMKEKKPFVETGNIRLINKKQETQGSNGSILTYHVNILLMEPLRPDSKVLKAILEYEK